MRLPVCFVGGCGSRSSIVNWRGCCLCKGKVGPACPLLANSCGDRTLCGDFAGGGVLTSCCGVVTAGAASSLPA